MAFSESDTRSKLIDPLIKKSEWLEFNIAIIEAKAESKNPLDGLQQSINYAQRLRIDFVYTTNGHKIYEHSLKDGNGQFIENYPTPPYNVPKSDFYNYILKCFVIIDLKRGKLTHQDNENLFVSKYQLYLPTEEELRAEIEKDVFELRLIRDVDG